jgi:hypothetical protein
MSKRFWIGFDFILLFLITLFFLMGDASTGETMFFGSLSILCIGHGFYNLKEDANEKEG